VLPAQRPIVPVPVYQEIHKKQRIVEVPQTVITDKVIPRLYHQEVFYEVPRLSLQFREKHIDFERTEFRERLFEVPVAVGYNYKVVPKWEIREVPKCVPRYVGEQQVIEIEVPQIQIRDVPLETEIPIYVGEKRVKKEVHEEEPVERIEYKYVEKEQEVAIFKYKPVFDVEVDIPPPLVVPIPIQPDQQQLPPETTSLEEYKRNRRNKSRPRSNCWYNCAVPEETGQRST